MRMEKRLSPWFKMAANPQRVSSFLKWDVHLLERLMPFIFLQKRGPIKTERIRYQGWRGANPFLLEWTRFQKELDVQERYQVVIKAICLILIRIASSYNFIIKLESFLKNLFS